MKKIIKNNNNKQTKSNNIELANAKPAKYDNISESTNVTIRD